MEQGELEDNGEYSPSSSTFVMNLNTNTNNTNNNLNNNNYMINTTTPFYQHQSSYNNKQHQHPRTSSSSSSSSSAMIVDVDRMVNRIVNNIKTSSSKQQHHHSSRSRSRSRSYSPNHSSADRSRSRSRSRSYSDSRSRSRSRSYSPYRINGRDSRSRSRSPSDCDRYDSRSRSRSRSTSHDSRDDNNNHNNNNGGRNTYTNKRDYNNNHTPRGNNNNNGYSQPSSILILNGIPPRLFNEDQIHESIKNSLNGGKCEKITFKKSLNGGCTVFAWFPTIQDATDYLKSHKHIKNGNGEINRGVGNSDLVIGESPVQIGYAFLNSTEFRHLKEQQLVYLQQDWMCENCNKSNFSWREKCFHCNESIAEYPRRIASAPGVKDDDDVPTTSLIIRDLESNLTTEDMLHFAFNSLGGNPPKTIRLIKKKDHNKCIAFVEYSTVQDSIFAFSNIKSLVVLNNQNYRVNYCKSEVHPTHNNNHHNNNNNNVANNNNNNNHKVSLANKYTMWSNAYSQQPQKQQQQQQQAPEGFVIEPTTGFYYNATSGYFFDVVKRVYFYYDTTTQSYKCYEQTTNNYVPFQPSNPVTLIGSSSSATTTPKPATSLPTTDKKKPGSGAPLTRVTPSLSRKKMDSEIERWNQKGRILKEAFETDETLLKYQSQLLPKSGSYSSVEYSIQQQLLQNRVTQQQNELNQLDHEYDEETINYNEYNDETSVGDHQQQQQQTLEQQQSSSSLSTSATNAQPIKFQMKSNSTTISAAPVINKSALASKLEANEQQQFIHQQLQQTINNQTKNELIQERGGNNSDKIICQLCDRMFPNYDSLFKHEKMSKLHLSNLEKQQQNNLNNNNNVHQHNGLENHHQQPQIEKKRKDQPNPFSTNSVGFKLLKKSGWDGGSSATSENNNHTNNNNHLSNNSNQNNNNNNNNNDSYGGGSKQLGQAINVMVRPSGAGLGSIKEQSSIDPKFQILPSDDYQTIVKKRALQRFHESGGSTLDESSNPFFRSSKR
ncbi:C2H2-type zinc finger-containing protein [Cavenderia fasciculata]|uniref:C2H2-type zinc finger-containing protein n=1 Tax=Cavenderia fasciculata TaxID=261658 RepID=F4PV49_CACFS|nr:C2H2-type zinc finger-containing protein [Cavenderia fasciculata]EGG21957.1 C2H2-type zinc finger-containing protein [Cavenderia fasciculata]|eukprot:XP_004359808.1 C2H2-type zinc finger-containing protein [Cavenderia fasciculata]